MQSVLPRRLVSAVQRYGLDRKRVLDCACGEGVYLSHLGSGSVGLELQHEVVEKANARGLDIRRCNLEEDQDWPVEPNGFDAIWCSNYFEHTLSPHHFLIRARRYLREGGLLVLAVPVLPSSKLLARFLERHRLWKEIHAADHVNFFTEYTLRRTVERAGFDSVETAVGSFPRPLVSTLAQCLKPIWFSILLAAKKIPDWEYPEKAHKRLVEERIVFKT